MIALTCRSFIRSVAGVIVGWCLFLTPAFAQLQTVYSDYGGATFLTRINAAANTFAGLGANYFDAIDAGIMQTSIQTDLQTIYQKFSVNFVTNLPVGTFETVTFFNTTPTSFGQAPFDWRNQAANQTANIFPANFNNTLLPGLLNNAFSKAQNRTRFATALAGTAAHELGHTFGLDHQDSYGTPLMTNQAATGGVQNLFVMRTGSTGAEAPERVIRPSFNPLETAKLEVTANMIANGFTTTPEQGAAHGTPALLRSSPLPHSRTTTSRRRLSAAPSSAQLGRLTCTASASSRMILSRLPSSMRHPSPARLIPC